MINPYCFTDEDTKTGSNIIIDSHNFSHANSILSIIPIYPDFGSETKYINKIFKKMATIYDRLINQNKCKSRIIFSASSYKIDEEDQRCDEIELCINLNIYHNLTETDINNIDVKSQLEHQIPIQKQRIQDGFLIKLIHWKSDFIKQENWMDQTMLKFL